jgi:arylformamidase
MSGEAPVYQSYDQRGLDAQYNNRARFPNFEEHFRSWRAWSDATKRRARGFIDVPFGPSQDERVDIFPSERGGAALYVFIHGGYWYSLDKADYSYISDGLMPHGIATVVNNFGLAPAHDMDEIVRQNRAMLAWLWRHAAEYGGDPDRIYVAGHSAGGHLAAMLLATDWPNFEPGLPERVAKGACAIGGIFDLEPVRLSFLNKTLHLTPGQVEASSPLRGRRRAGAPLLLVVAADESDEFHRQSGEMEKFWSQGGSPCRLVVPAGLDHFDVVNQLKDPACELVRLQLDHMRSAFGG